MLYCYLSSPKPNSSFLSDFSDFISSVVLSHDKILLVGDFNIHVDDLTNSFASEFLNTCDSLNLKQHVSHPTHVQGHTLDLVFTVGLSVNSLTLIDLFLITKLSCLILPYK